MKIATIVSRVLLGLGFAFFGLNIIFSFLPQPPLPPESLPAQFTAVMGPTHWMTVVGFFQLVGGLLVLFKRTTPIGLILLAPVLVNILLFHICLMGGAGIIPGLVFSALEAFLVFAYWPRFRCIFSNER